MKALSKTLRNQLERAVVTARDTAEAGAAAALERLAVDKPDAFNHMTPDQRGLRVKLRARGRQLGDELEKKGEQDIWHLHRECAYEYWHQMLFARFLAENHLLMHPDGVPVTLDECEELAAEERTDGWTLAARYASRMLPQIFRPDDPLLQVVYAPEDKQAMEEILAGLPAESFTASDSLGWCYQFWQSEEKDEVNKSGNKIGADELPAVTQLFTEDYMVDFLLDNTLGAWHAGKMLAANPKLAENAESEEELRKAVTLPGVEWKYLRFIKGKDGKWTPAAGTFDGWPKTAKELKCLDPCMGSGHFVVAMFERLVALRMAEEKLDEAAAVAAVIRDNLFGLEIDPRCTQIGAFNLALAAWRRVGHRPLPAMNLACSGLAPNTREADWLAMAGDNQKLQRGMERLYRLFQEAAVLGSLINPRAGKGDLLEAGFHELQPLLEKALVQETKDDTAHEMAVTARGLAKAAETLASQFTLVATNVPYLGRGKQDDILKEYCERVYPEAKPDLATSFVERCSHFCATGGSTALVTPQNWLFLATYQSLRKKFLGDIELRIVAELGAGAFQTPLYDFSFALFLATRAVPSANYYYATLVASHSREIEDKVEALSQSACFRVTMKSVQAQNDCRIVTQPSESDAKQLSVYALPNTGLQTGDNDHYSFLFWELPCLLPGWEFFHRTSQDTRHFGGRLRILFWEDGSGSLVAEDGCAIRGLNCQGNRGVLVHRMGELPVTLFSGEMFDQNGAAIIPIEEKNLDALWCFLASDSYRAEVRKLDNKVGVTPATLAKVPFDLTHWQKVAAEEYPHGLPKPFSSDPTQWLFNGHPKDSDQPLHVAVARLLGYRWPRQTGSSFPDCPALGPDGLEKLADVDGIVCIPAVSGEEPAADRLLALLSACGIKSDRNLDDWLRDGFFDEHCKLFHQRPFIWHIWDGRKKDGFHALVNYHKLDRKGLEKLIFTYLGDWIARQKAAEQRGEGGAEARLLAAEDLQKRLKLILEGEPPYDIFVRWKPLEEQPIGWEPDLNDGVRMNIRPFVEAGVLRKNPNIKWTKDRGKEPDRDKKQFPWFWGWDCETENFMGGSEFDGDRWNDCHYSNDTKRAARTATPRARRDPSPKTPTAAEDDDEADYEQAEDTQELDDEADDEPSELDDEEVPLRFDDLESEDILAAVRQAFASGGPRDRDTAIRDVFDMLPGERLTARIQEEINSALITATHRGIACTNGGLIQADCRKIGDYPRDLLKKYLLGMMKGNWWEQDEAIRAAARHLGFRKAGKSIQAEFTSAIRGAIRQGLIDRDGSLIRRAK